MTGVDLLSNAHAQSHRDKAQLMLLCEDGVRIFVDGRKAGTCRAEKEGLFLFLSPGHHDLRAEKVGFNTPWKKRITLRTGPNPELRIEFKRQRIQVEPLGESKHNSVTERLGVLEVRSVPPRPKPRVRLNGRDVGKAPLRAKIPAGKVTVEAVQGGVRIVDDFKLTPIYPLVIEIDFINRKMTNTGPRVRRKSCTPSGDLPLAKWEMQQILKKGRIRLVEEDYEFKMVLDNSTRCWKKSRQQEFRMCIIVLRA